MKALLAPEPHLGRLFKGECDSRVNSEFGHAQSAFLSGANVDDVLDLSQVIVRITLQNAPLSPTIVKGIKHLLPGAESNDEKGLEVIDPKITRPAISPTELIETMVDAYRRVPSPSKITLFTSAGFDSRLELALILKTFPETEIELAHFHESSDASKTVSQIAELKGLKLRLLDPSVFRHQFLSTGTNLAMVAEEPNWRISVPQYLAATTEFLQSGSTVLGYTPWELKGRYEPRMPSHPGEIRHGMWRLRLVDPGEICDREADRKKALDTQVAYWRRIFRVTGSLQESRKMDYANWALGYGNTYSHRMKLAREMGLSQVNGTSEILFQFARIPQRIKMGSSLIRTLIELIDPELSQIPIFSSSERFPRSPQTPDWAKNASQSDSELEVHLEKLESTLRENVSYADFERSKVWRFLDRVASERPGNRASLTSRQIRVFTLMAAKNSSSGVNPV